MSYDIDELIALQVEQCSRLTRGECLSARCLRRGGFTPPDDDAGKTVATCEHFEIVAALCDLKRLQ